VEGGCANDYVYTHGDPINTFDLDGGKTVKCPKEGDRIVVDKPNGSRLTVTGLGGGRFEVGVVSSYGMAPFILDSVIYAQGKKANGKRYANTTRATDKLKDAYHNGSYDISANHLTTDALKGGSTLSIRAEQPWSEEAWYPVGKYGIATGDLWEFSCKV